MLVTSDSDLHAYLRFPLYPLTTETTLRSGLTSGQQEYWRTRHEPDQLRGILEALEWAEKHPRFPFGTLLPDLGFDDKSLYEYLCQIKVDFAKIVSGLVEQDAPNSPGM